MLFRKFETIYCIKVHTNDVGESTLSSVRKVGIA